MTQETVEKATEKSEDKKDAPKDQELLIGEGAVELFQQDGKFFLSQGEVAVDITKILAGVNYPAGKLVLNVRLTNHQGTPGDNSSREWLYDELSAPGPRIAENMDHAHLQQVRDAEKAKEQQERLEND